LLFSIRNQRKPFSAAANMKIACTQFHARIKLNQEHLIKWTKTQLQTLSHRAPRHSEIAVRLTALGLAVEVQVADRVVADALTDPAPRALVRSARKKPRRLITSWLISCAVI
jgi:hypothetical protein